MNGCSDVNNASRSSNDDDPSQSDIPSHAITLFSSQDCKDIFATLTRKRALNGRGIMWLLMVIYAALMIPQYGAGYLAYPVSELLYKWDLQTFGFVGGLMCALNPIVVTLFTMTFVKFFEPNDLEIIVIGITSSTLGWIGVGSITSEYGLYLNGVTGSLMAAAISGIRSFLSLIVPGNEIGKVFSIMQLVDTITSFLSPALSSIAFRATISWYPTFTYHCFAIILIISLAIATGIDVSRRIMLCRDQKIISDDSSPENEVDDMSEEDDTAGSLCTNRRVQRQNNGCDIAT